MSTTTTQEFRNIPVAALTFSTTRSQVERRAHFDKAAMKELADSIRSHGVVQPILVRPFRDEHVKGEAFEVVAGERRALASRQAGVDEIPATIRELSDEQVLELQLIENLQRTDLHELAEAEGYESLQKLGHSVDDISAKVGKSKATIYARMKLLALCKDARAAFYGGKISASVALLLARIPVESVQKEALKGSTQSRYDDAPPSYRDVADSIQRKYMMRLEQAPFPVDSVDLVKGALPCGRCPKNTIAQPELFGDVKASAAGVCTDPACFAAKKAAHVKNQVVAAKAAGQTVIEGKEAKAIFPHGTYNAQNGYVKLDDTRYVGGKSHKVAAVIGKSATPTLVRTKDGDLIPVVSESALRTAMKAKGIGQEKSASRGASKGSATARKKGDPTAPAQINALFRAIHDKAPRKLNVDSLVKIAGILSECGNGFTDIVEAAHGWKPGAGAREADSLKEPELHRLLWEMLVAEELDLSFTESLQLEKLTKVAISLKIDAAAVKAKAKADCAAPPKPPAKKASAKPRSKK